MGPEYHLVLAWVTPALKKVEKRVVSFDIDVPHVRVDGAMAKGRCLDMDAVTWKDEIGETSVVCGGECREVFVLVREMLTALAKLASNSVANKSPCIIPS